MPGPVIGRRGTLAAGLALPFIRPAFAQQAEPYVMGSLFPMSGPNAEFGEAFTRGAQVALSHIAADNMLGRPVRLQAEDSQALPQPSVVGMNKLISIDRAVWVLVSWTATSKAVAPIGDRAKVIMVSLPRPTSAAAAFWMCATRGFHRQLAMRAAGPLPPWCAALPRPV